MVKSLAKQTCCTAQKVGEAFEDALEEVNNLSFLSSQLIDASGQFLQPDGASQTIVQNRADELVEFSFDGQNWQHLLPDAFMTVNHSIDLVRFQSTDTVFVVANHFG